MIITITEVSIGNNLINDEYNRDFAHVYATTANGQVFCYKNRLCVDHLHGDDMSRADCLMDAVYDRGSIDTTHWTKVRNANGSRPKALGSRPAKAARAPQPRVAVKAAPADTEVAKLKKQLAAVTIRARKAEAQLYALTGKAAA